MSWVCNWSSRPPCETDRREIGSRGEQMADIVPDAPRAARGGPSVTDTLSALSFAQNRVCHLLGVAYPTANAPASVLTPLPAPSPAGFRFAGPTWETGRTAAAAWVTGVITPLQVSGTDMNTASTARRDRGGLA